MQSTKYSQLVRFVRSTRLPGALRQTSFRQTGYSHGRLSRPACRSDQDQSEKDGLSFYSLDTYTDTGAHGQRDENLVEILNDCISDLKHWADKRKVNVKADLPNQFILEVDRIRIEQLINNILSNAIKYTPPNGNIIIELNDSEKYVEISIRDTGIGLTKKEKEKLFQKFGKIERVGKQLDIETEGTGLGLYISKEIVELHKGKILVKSPGRNKGSTFLIRLPK